MKEIALINGNIITLDEQVPEAEAVYIQDGKIVKVGDQQDIDSYITNDTEVIDLQGKTVLPGFIESHTHPLSFGIGSVFELDCRASAVGSIEEMKSKLQEHANQHQDHEWIYGYGWNENKLTEKQVPTKWDLDDAVPDRPVVLRRTCGHIYVANSKALELAGINQDTPDPPGGRIVRDSTTNEPTGVLEESANLLLPKPKYSLADAAEGLRHVQDYCLSHGITTIHEALIGKPFDYQVYQHAQRNNELDVRFRLWFWAIKNEERYGFLDSMIGMGLESGFGNDMLNIQGSKFMIDGAGSGKTAAVYEPYVDDPDNYGLLLYEEDKMISEITRSIEHGLRVAVHAIGDHAMEIAIKSFENALNVKSAEEIREMRNRIEHCVLPVGDHLERMKQLNLIASSSTGFISQIGDNYCKYFGTERANLMFPHRTYQKYGIVAPGNSDLPVTDANPFTGIYGLVTRKTETGALFAEHEAISTLDAIKAYTIDAAYAACEEDKLGSISENKLADLIIVSENPLTVDPDHLKDLEVELTMVNGEVLYDKR